MQGLAAVETVAYENAILGWHWLNAAGTLAKYGGDEPTVKVEAGKTYAVDGVISACNRGLHGSVRAIDALVHAPGPIICRVKSWGAVSRERNKYATSHREVLWMADATKVLREFAASCAERALDRQEAAGRKVHPDSRNAVAVARKFARGEATEEELAAAWDAARAAAWAAARAAARDEEVEWQNAQLTALLESLAPAEFASGS